MRFLGIGDVCDLHALYRSLLREGHEVRVYIGDPACHDTGRGLVDRVDEWRDHLPWVREAASNGILLFENVAAGRGAEQDELRRQGYHVIGGSAFGDRLENDRAFAQAVLSDLGLRTCRIWEFHDAAVAVDFLDRNPGRYVLKMNGPTLLSSDTYIGQFDDGRDVRAMVTAKVRARGKISFVLMEHLKGIEMGVGAYFNGSDFLLPACLDWEHKRFFAGDMGELTGEMGTVVTYSRTKTFFNMTLAKMAPLLKASGYCGYINLNTIVNEEGIWPLEFTCRFGYPGFAILDPLQTEGWSSLFSSMVSRDRLDFPIEPGFSLGIVMTTPPFPYTRKQFADSIGLPILMQPEHAWEDEPHLHYGEVGLLEEQLVTTGIAGWTMVVTGCGMTVGEAKEGAYRRAARVYAPNIRYRLDIGDRLVAGDLERVERLGLFDAPL